MIRRLRWSAGAAILAALATASLATEEATVAILSASEAIDHVGKNATVCGAVASAKFASSSRGQPTFINLDRPYPDHVFTIVIWGSNRSAFGQPEETYRDKRVCVTGKIDTYRGKPQIEARKPTQIKLQAPAGS